LEAAVRRALLTIALLSAAGPGLAAASSPRPSDAAVERGHGLAVRHCSECHSVTIFGESPDGDAPRFPVLRMRYNELSLARRLAGASRGGHAGMPPIPMTESERRDLIAYIESLVSPGV
jgi:mono/diheme cytochrome c family protein